MTKPLRDWRSPCGLYVRAVAPPLTCSDCRSRQWATEGLVLLPPSTAREVGPAEMAERLAALSNDGPTRHAYPNGSWCSVHERIEPIPADAPTTGGLDVPRVLAAMGHVGLQVIVPRGVPWPDDATIAAEYARLASTATGEPE